jgi:hypothetical protein
MTAKSPIIGEATTALAPPTVTMPMPAPSLTMTAGGTLTLKWNPVTEDTAGAPITGVTYNVWEVSSGSAALLESGLTVAQRVHANMAVGTPCYVVTASVPGDIDSEGSSPSFCVNVVPAPVQPAVPINVNGVAT